MNKRKLLFVDDEPSIRLTLPAILSMHGYEVEAAGTVAEALAKIQQSTFDVLIADLNIGQPGDGFTVVSAMRRTQPDAVTLILTGYPAFETALEAIRQQVDDYVVKPANVDALVNSIEAKLTNRKAQRPMPLVRASLLLRENQGAIIEDWLRAVERNPALSHIALPRAERSDHVPDVLAEVLASLDRGQRSLSESSIANAARHGRVRSRQRYTAPMLVEEARLLRAAIMDCLREHLLRIDLSRLLGDMCDIDFVLDGMLVESIRGFTEGERKAA